MSDNGAANLEPLVSRSDYDDAIGFALRQFVGRGKRFTSARMLEGPSGVAWRAIEAARNYADNPEHRHLPADKLASLGRVLGPEFTTLWMAKLMGQGAFWMPDAEPISPRDLACDAVDDAAKINRHLGDNDISGEDERELQPVGLRMIAAGAALAFAPANAA